MASDPPTPAPLDPDRFNTPMPPAGTGTLGMWLFLVSLSMLFAAAMTAYLVIRLAGTRSPQSGTIHLPSILWLSTCLVIAVSVTMSRALAALRRERQEAFKIGIGIAMLLALGFLAVQSPAMVMLLHAHYKQRLIGKGIFLYGLLFVLILLHALHVLGGIVSLVIVAVRSKQGAYDHEHYQPVRHVAMYWHFLDIIWIMMFAAFLATA